MFNRRLLIAFDAASRTVSFDLVNDGHLVRALFSALDDQLENRARTVFTAVPYPD